MNVNDDHAPHIRQSGRGPAVVCLHSSISSSKQWKGLMTELESDHHVIAPDLYGYGASPVPAKADPFSIDHEIELLCQMLADIPGPFHLIGHSYGAAVAFRLAVRYPTRVRSLVAYEPVLFNLMVGDDSDEATEIGSVRTEVEAMVGKGEFEEAAERFVDYWSGAGVWNKMPVSAKDKIIQRMWKVVFDFEAVLGNMTTLSDYAKFDIPTLYLYGTESPASTRKIAEWLGQTLPKAEVRGLIGVGHMGPMTHSSGVIKLIANFVRKQPKGILVHQLKRSGSQTESD